MTDPKPEHIDAVARAINSNHHPYGVGTPEWDERARRLLGSQNPAVHAALAESIPDEVMLDALTRHGVLTQEWGVRHSRGQHPGPFTEKDAREWIAADVEADKRRQWSARGRQALVHRHVSQWEVAP